MSSLDFSLTVDDPEGPQFLLNFPLKFVLSDFVRRMKMSLPRFVELVQMQTKEDYQPDKDEVPSVISSLCRDYKNLHL